MNVPAVSNGGLAAAIDLPLPWALLAWLLAALSLGWALSAIDWRRLRDFEAQLAFVGVLALSVAARAGRIELQPGMDLHLFGASIAALMFGWRFALIVQALAVTVVALAWQHWWVNPALDYLITGCVPVLATTALLDLAQRKLPLHLFVYLLLNAFFAGALAIVLAHTGKILLLSMLGAYSGDALVENFVLTLPALMFPEGFATGAVLTFLVAWRPRWVATFHDPSYLGTS